MTETLSLDSRDPGWISTRHPIPAGKVAIVTISGDVGIWSGWRSGIDGAYCHNCPPGTYYSQFPKPHRVLHIQTNYGHFNPEGGYNPSHHYQWHVPGNGQPMSFHFSDDANQTDNSGSFAVTVNW